MECCLSRFKFKSKELELLKKRSHKEQEMKQEALDQAPASLQFSSLRQPGWSCCSGEQLVGAAVTSWEVPGLYEMSLVSAGTGVCSPGTW